MKKIAVALLLLSVCTVLVRRHPTQSERQDTQLALSLSPLANPGNSAPNLFEKSEATPDEAPAGSDMPPAFKAFADWADKFLDTPSRQGDALLEEGRKLAGLRR